MTAICPLCSCDRYRRDIYGWACADCDFLAAPFTVGDSAASSPTGIAEAIGDELDRCRYAEADTLARRGVQS